MIPFTQVELPADWAGGQVSRHTVTGQNKHGQPQVVVFFTLEDEGWSERKDAEIAQRLWG